MSTQFVIHLRNDQQKTGPFLHPMQEHVHELSDEEMTELLTIYLNDSLDETTRDHARQDLIMGHIHTVNWLIGRYVCYWPESKKYLDDMYAEGLLAITEVVSEARTNNSIALKAKNIVRIKRRIEDMLNNMRFPIRASLNTQFRRIQEKCPPEYIDAAVLTDKQNVHTTDDGYMVIDLLDALERIKECDTEEMIDLVLLAMENHHHIRKQDISDEDRDLIEQLVKIGGDCVYSS